MTFSSMQRKWRPPAEPGLPPYPEHHAASAIGQQVANRSSRWVQVARGLREEIAETEEALVSALDDENRRAANRARIRAAAISNSDRGLR